MSFKNLFLNKKEIVILDPNHWVLYDKFVEVVVMERLFGMLYCDKVDANVVMGETQTLSALYDKLKDNSPRDIIIVLLTLNKNQSYDISSIIAEKDDVDEFTRDLYASIEAGYGDDDSYEYTASYIRGRIDKEKFHNRCLNDPTLQSEILTNSYHKIPITDIPMIESHCFQKKNCELSLFIKQYSN